MPTKLYFPAVLLLLLTFAIAGCEKGNGVLVTQTFELQNFDKIDLRRHADIYLTQGPTQSVTIEAEENLMELITTDVVNGEWKIDFQKTVKEYLTMTIHITVPNVSSLKVIDGSGGDIFLENALTAQNLHVELSGDGTINGEINVADTLTTSLQGSGSITLSGTANYLDLSSEGTGTVSAFGLVANNGAVQVLGSGVAQVNFIDSWQARITSSGNIQYKGTAPSSTEITGTGTVTQVP